MIMYCSWVLIEHTYSCVSVVLFMFIVFLLLLLLFFFAVSD